MTGAPTSDNTHQGDLFAQEPDRAQTMTEAFLEFHRANPHVYRALRDLARNWLTQGKTKCSITLLYNVARWSLSLRTEGEGMFELNDHYQAYYARALMRFEPDLAGMFNIRTAPEADSWIASFDEAAA
ncbi:hypothetical protein [Pseudonocardia sp. NPDC049154]|uniref:hypothetical protein n=1 Tax=Pseudonocardia sp. NPDC049154 TaxID=3155501 RepID=UPI0033F6C7B3